MRKKERGCEGFGRVLDNVSNGYRFFVMVDLNSGADESGRGLYL